MPISISKSPNWVPGKGFTFSNQHGGTGGMSMGGGATPPVPPAPEPVNDIFTKMLMHFDDNVTSSTSATIASVFAPMQGVASPDGTKVYMGTWGSTSASNGLHVIDVATNTKTATISTPGTTIDHTVNSTGTRVYSTQYGTTNSNNSGTNVYVINTTNNTLLATVPVGSAAHSVAITPDDKFVFVACENSGLYRIDTSTNSATNLSISTGKFAVEVSPDGTKLLFSNGSNVYVYSINTTTGAVSLLSTLAGFSGAYTSTKNANYAYFLNNSAGTVIPVSWSTLTAETAITVGSGPYGACVSTDGKKLFVTNNTTGSVSVIDTTSNKVIDTITGYSSPRGAVFAGNKLFVCNNGASNVPVVDMRTFSDAALSPMLQNRAGTSVLTSTTQSKFGGKSLALNGTNTNKLQFANPKVKAMDLSNKPFCVEGWFYLTSNNTTGHYVGLMSWANTDNGDCQGIHIDLNSSNQFAVHMTTNGSSWDLGIPTIVTSASPTLNTWFHLALIRETVGGDIKLVHNGVVIGTKATTSSLYTGDYFYVGKINYFNDTRINGYVDDVRVVVGSCPYSSSAFVVPTAELTATADTKLLIKGSTTIKDDSSLNLYTQTGGSAASSTVQSKFGGSSIKIASATGDFIKVYNNTQPIALFDRPFTIEGWFWLNSNTAGFQPIITMGTSADYQGPIIIMQSNNTLNAYLTTNVSASDWNHYVSTSFTPSANAWHHIALVREYTSGPIKLYCDGVLRGSNSTTSSVFTAENVWAGHYPYFPGGARTLNGYVDEVRITLDYCAYNGNFTPAAAPFTDGKNLLMHFDGANNSTTMTDSSTYARVATASGGAVISTTKSKFGGSSLYLPGNNTNAVVMANSSDFAFGTGDFTVEAWINIAGMSAGLSGTYYNAIFDTGAGNNSGRLFFCLNSSRKLIAFNGSGVFFTGSTSLILDSWYHVAVARKGSLFFVYLNGSLEGSATVSFNLTESAMRIGSNFDAASVGGIGFNGYMDEFRVTKGTALYAPNPAPATKFSLIGDSTPNQVTALGSTFEMSKPGVSATGIPTLGAISDGIKFFSPVGSANMFFAKDVTNTKTASQAKTVVASFKYPNSNFGSASFISSIALKDSVSGRYIAFYNSTNANNPTQWGYVTGTSDANGAPVWGSFTRVGNDVNAVQNQNFWIKLVDDGTNYITGYFSYDVTNPSWTQAFQVARTGWLTNGSSEIGVVGVADALTIDCEFILTSWSVT